MRRLAGNFDLIYLNMKRSEHVWLRKRKVGSSVDSALTKLEKTFILTSQAMTSTLLWSIPDCQIELSGSNTSSIVYPLLNAFLSLSSSRATRTEFRAFDHIAAPKQMRG